LVIGKISKAPLTGQSNPATVPQFSSFGAPTLTLISRWKVEAADMFPPLVQIGDRYVHHKIVCPFLDVVVL
jgi:hypothetical protein